MEHGRQCALLWHASQKRHLVAHDFLRSMVCIDDGEFVGRTYVTSHLLDKCGQV